MTAKVSKRGLGEAVECLSKPQSLQSDRLLHESLGLYPLLAGWLGAWS